MIKTVKKSKGKRNIKFRIRVTSEGQKRELDWDDSQFTWGF